MISPAQFRSPLPQPYGPGLRPAWGQYAAPGKPPELAIITDIEISGWAISPKGIKPLTKLRLNPAETDLRGRCSCPVSWRVFPEKPAEPLPELPLPQFLLPNTLTPFQPAGVGPIMPQGG